jgi:RAP domain
VVLAALPIDCPPLQVEALVCDDTQRANILVTDGEHRIVVEADGPTHFVRGSDGVIVHQDGPTQLRDNLFHVAGYKVISVRVEGIHLSVFRPSEFRCRLLGQLQALGIGI